jgi:MATE family, multidrug efflux pump
VTGQLSAIGMNVIDAMLAGHLDAHTLGAVAVGTSVWSLALVAAIGVMLALPPSVAQLNGADRRPEIGALFRQALWLALVLGIGLLIGVHFGGPVLVRAIGVDAALLPDVTRFLHAISFGAPALTLFFALRGLSEGFGLTRPTMYFSLLGLGLLAPVGYVLMYGKLGFPALGALGSGIATACVIWIEALAFLLYVATRKRKYGSLELFARFDRPNFVEIGELLRIGVPMGVSVFMEASLFVAVALAIGTLGTDVVASHQIAINVASVTFMVPLGIAMATTVRVGHAVGRGDREGVRGAGAAGLVLTLLAQGFSAILMLTIPERIAALYTSDTAVIVLAAQLLVLAGFFQFSDGMQVAASGALRGLKDTRVPMVITTFAYWGVGMPVGWWLAFPLGFGARGMWMGLIAGLSMAAVLLTLRFWRLVRAPAATAPA